MDVLLDSFLSYLAVEKGLSENTLESYGRDLRKFILSMEEAGVSSPGEIKYSHILIVRTMQSQTPVTIMPNPANGYVNVNVYADKNIPASFTLIDKVGRKVLAQKQSLTKGFNNIVLNLDGLSEGVYALIIENASERITRHLIIIR